MSKEKSYILFARKFFLGTMSSRILGLVRDMLLAFYFGASLAHFFVAFRFVYLFRRLFGEGAIQPGFIPHFQQIRCKEEKEAYFFFRDAFFSIGIPILLFIVLSESLLSPFSHMPMVSLAMILLPSVFFLYLYVLSSSFLQAHHRYFLPSFMPVLCNLAWIGSIFFAAYNPSLTPEKVLSVGVLIGFAVQGVVPMIQAIFLSPVSLQEWRIFRFFSPACRALFLSIFWLVLGVGATQINSAIDSLFAQSAHQNGAAYLWYAIRLQQLPLALFAIAFSGAILPSLSLFSSKKEDSEIDAIATSSSLHVTALIVPATMLPFLLGPQLLTLFFGRGHFTFVDLQETLKALYAYSFGLLPMSLCLIFSSVLFAKKRYQKGACISFFSVGCNVLLNSLFLFYFRLGPMSVALATSVSALLQLVALLFTLKELSGWRKEGKEVGKIFFGAVTAYLCTGWLFGNGLFIVGSFQETIINDSATSLIFKVAAPLTVYIVLYGIICRWISAKSFLELFARTKLYGPRTHKQEQH